MTEDNILVPETDATRINELINHESIRQSIGGSLNGVHDASYLVNDQNNIFFTGELGGCGLFKSGDGWNLHSFVLPEGRGKWMIDHAKEVIKWIFENTGAKYIVTLCPKENKAARGGALLLGFRKYQDDWYVLYANS